MNGLTYPFECPKGTLTLICHKPNSCSSHLPHPQSVFLPVFSIQETAPLSILLLKPESKTILDTSHPSPSSHLLLHHQARLLSLYHLTPPSLFHFGHSHLDQVTWTTLIAFELVSCEIWPSCNPSSSHNGWDLFKTHIRSPTPYLISTEQNK